MKKQIILLAMMLLPMVARAQETVEIDGIWYNLIAKGKVAEVTNRLGGDSNGDRSYKESVDIPPTVTYDGVDYDVTGIGQYAFYICSGLTSITIPNSVTSIGKYAFEGCSGLTSITIPNSVTSIGDFAFMNCSGLTSVTIPGSVTSIGYMAFYGCSGLTSITIPNSVTSIGKYAFEGCSGLTSVTIGNSVTSIGDYAFYGCSGLTSVTIPNSVTSIGEGAFHGCSGLTSVTIPGSVTSIGYMAFYGCSGLTSITIPNSVTSIGKYAFEGCSGLTSVTIGNSVTSIGDYAFYGCSGLTSVTIPNSVTSIGEGAFHGCSGLTSITIGSGVKRIYSQAFASCKELTDVYCLAEMFPNTSTDAFKDSYIEYATLHVPAAFINYYKTKEPWKYFKNFKTIEEQQLPKCSTPTISFDKSGLVFNCETPDVEYSYEIKNTDVKKGVADGNRVELNPVYTITYYAMKAGFENSDVATATIRWRNGSPVFQGFVKVDAGEGALWGDVNIDGQVDVADIANIIDIMAGK